MISNALYIMKKGFLKIVLSLTMIFSFAQYTLAQCVMCRSAIEDDKEAAEGFNSGILYLMVIPYIILAGTLYFIIKHRRERRAQGKE